MTIQKILKQAAENQKALNEAMPHKTMCMLGSRSISLSGDQICITPDGDYMTVEEIQEAMQWLIEQFGGQVKWVNK